MGTITKKKNILAAPDILKRLPELRGVATAEPEQNAADLLRIAALFEVPVRAPFFSEQRFPYLPQFIRSALRAFYGLGVFLHEKFDTNRKAAHFLLLEQMWRAREDGKKGKASRRAVRS